MTVAAQRVFVFDLYEFAHRALPIADDMGRLTPSRCYQLVTDHEQAEIAAFGIALNDHAVALAVGELVGLRYLCASAEIGGHAAAEVAVLRLDHNRQANFLGSLPRIFSIADS